MLHHFVKHSVPVFLDKYKRSIYMYIIYGKMFY